MSKRVDTKRAARAARAAREQLARRRRRTMWTSIVAAVALVLAGGAGYGVYRARQPAQGMATPAGATADRTGISVGTGPVVVEIFLDYLCPACQRFEADAYDELKAYLDQNRITLVVHPVAILDRYSTNRYSTRSAVSAGCAADAGKIFEYGQALYARQPAEGGPGHTDEELIRIGASVGLDASFAQCVRDDRYHDWVTHVTGSMVGRNVTGTPTVFVGGRQLSRPSASTLTAAVDAA